MARWLRWIVAWFGYRLRNGWRAPAPNAFDLEFDTDTAPDSVLAAAPIPPQTFDRWMAELPIAHPDFTLIHLGSGAGRLLLFASRYPFARVVGVEPDAGLAYRAQHNLGVWEGPARRRARARCNQVHAVRADPAEWPLPPVPSVFVVSMQLASGAGASGARFKPAAHSGSSFRLHARGEAGRPKTANRLGATPAMQLAAMAAHIRASLAGSPREAYILHLGDAGHTTWEPADGFTPVGEAEGAWIYRFTPLEGANLDS